MSPRIKLQQVYFYSNRYSADLNASGNLILQKGWVVTGLMDSNRDTYYIPKTHRGQPIVGIYYTAYETMIEYKDDDAYHSKGDINTDLPVTICFDDFNMRFVFPPRRYTDRYLVIPTYYANCTGAYGEKNYAFMYDAMYFSYSRSHPLTAAIGKYANMPYNCGYGTLGKCTVGRKHYKISRDSYGRETKKLERTEEVVINLRQSSYDTFSLAKRDWREPYLSKTPENFYELEKVSWRTLRVGKYYDLGVYGNFKEIKKDFDDKSSVLVFGYTIVGKTANYAFDFINGTTEIASYGRNDMEF